MSSPTSESLLEKGEELPPVQQDSRGELARRTLVWALQSVRPSLFDKPSGRKVRLRRTAYLDGLRGFAALLVYIIHHELWAHEAQRADIRLQGSFGSHGEYYFAAFPWVRTFFTGGHLAVAIFFVLSGYVLSAKPLALIHVGDHVALCDNVASALFRRWFRLYLPIVIVTFVLITLHHWTGIHLTWEPEGSYRAEVWKWYTEFHKFSFIFGQPLLPWFHFHNHTWTIPVELKGSVLTYMSSIVLSRCTQKARLWCLVGLAFYFLYIVDAAFYAMFMAGMILCDIDLMSTLDKLPAWTSQIQRFGTVLFHLMFVVGLYLGGAPSYSTDFSYLVDEPGWYHLSFFKPRAVYDFKWFYNFWGAIFIIASIARISWAKRFFETRFCQYLGRISYMFYLLHGPVLWTLGDRLYASVGWSRETHALVLPGWADKVPLPKVGPLGLEFSFLVPNLILLPVTMWVADMATGLIDDPCIRFASWLFRKTQQPQELKELA